MRSFAYVIPLLLLIACEGTIVTSERDLDAGVDPATVADASVDPSSDPDDAGFCTDPFGHRVHCPTAVLYCWNGVCDPGEEGKCPSDCIYCGNYRCDDIERFPNACPVDCGGQHAAFCGDRVEVSAVPVALPEPDATLGLTDVDEIAGALGLTGERARHDDGLERGLDENELQIELSNDRYVIVGLEWDGGHRGVVVYGFTGQRDGVIAEYDIYDPLTGIARRDSYHALQYGAGTGDGDYTFWGQTLYRLSPEPIVCD